MTSNPSDNVNEKKCEYCGTDRTYIAVTKNGTPYPKWNNDPFKENTLICGKWYRNLLYHKILPQVMSGEVFKWRELHIGFVINAAERQLCKETHLRLMTLTYGIGIRVEVNEIERKTLPNER